MAEGESLSQHAAAASQGALEMAGVAAEEVDLIILATSSPDDLFGSACQVRHATPLGHTNSAEDLSGMDHHVAKRRCMKGLRRCMVAKSITLLMQARRPGS